MTSRYPRLVCLRSLGGVLCGLAGHRCRVGEPQASALFWAGTRLAHAEVNVVIQIPTGDIEQMAEGRLDTTLEPCPFGVGAITMSGVRHVTYAAYDHRPRGFSKFRRGPKNRLRCRDPWRAWRSSRWDC